MRPADLQRARELNDALVRFDASVRRLPGIADARRREVLVAQMIDSLRRVEYARKLPLANISEHRNDPDSVMFDPLKAAVLQYRRGAIDEAFWLVFLFVHFGRDRHGGWSYIRSVYGGLGTRRWDWATVSCDPTAFGRWLEANAVAIKAAGGGFGNHRKYESLKGTGYTVETYVNWVLSRGDHASVVAHADSEAAGDSKRAFDILFKSMEIVARFGRTARFDYLTMLAKLGFAHIEPGSAYLTNATGPLVGANVLFGGCNKARTLNDWLVELDASLGVGMQVIEDALCNWQKSPARYTAFRG